MCGTIVQSVTLLLYNPSDVWVWSWSWVKVQGSVLFRTLKIHNQTCWLYEKLCWCNSVHSSFTWCMRIEKKNCLPAQQTSVSRTSHLTNKARQMFSRPDRRIKIKFVAKAWWGNNTATYINLTQLCCYTIIVWVQQFM